MYEGPIQTLIDELGRLPGIGPKSAQRIAFHLLQADEVDVKRLVDSLLEVQAKVRFCETCGNKRCPHANWHGHACTGSNDSGQPGSAYP